MEQKTADELFSRMNAFLAENDPESGSEANDPDADGLPFESLDDFSTDPVEFGEMAERMLRKVENLFDLSAVFNRHSAKYLKTCALLEKGIRFLGSACITKSAMEREKISFPELGQLSTMKLYRMASFNYRKLDTALTENIQRNNDVFPELLDMEFRFFNLLQRLRSTETKIHNYHYHLDRGSTNCDPVREGTAFSEGSWAKYDTQKQEEAPAFRIAPAFPLLSGAEIRNKKTAAGQAGNCPMPAGDENSETKTGEQKSGKNTTVPHSAARIPDSEAPAPAPERLTPHSYTDPSGCVHIDVSGLRQQMMKEAHDSGEIDLMMEIAGEPPEKIYERYRQKYGGSPRSGPNHPSRSGPSAEKRKKLRKKRK